MRKVNRTAVMEYIHILYAHVQPSSGKPNMKIEVGLDMRRLIMWNMVTLDGFFEG